MSVHIHRQPGAGWTKLPNTLLRDTRMSARARGVLVTFLSHEDGWQQSVAFTSREMTDGVYSIRAAIAELVELGYIVRRRGTRSRGRWTTDLHVYDEPQAKTMQSTAVGQTAVGQTAVGQTAVSTKKPLDVEPLDVEPQGDLELASAARSRAADPIFETLFTLETGLPYSPENRTTLTRSALAALQKPAAEIRDTGITEEELRSAIANWPQVMRDATCTAFAVAKHLPRLRAASRGMVARRSDFDQLVAEAIAMRKRREQEAAR